MTRAVCAALAILMIGRTLGACTQAAEGARVAASSPGLAAEIRRLVELLDAPQRAVRDKAEKQLREFGPQILPQLLDLVPRSAEAKLRLERLRQDLTAELIRGEAEPARVTIDADGWTLQKVLDDIYKQTGNRLVAHGDLAERSISLRLEAKPFWPAVDHLAGILGAGLRFGAAGTVELVPDRHAIDPGMVHYFGPFRLVMTGFSDTRVEELRPDAGPSSGRLFVRLQLAWEPRIQPAFLWWGPVELVCPSRQSQSIPVSLRREIPILGSACAIEIAVPVENYRASSDNCRLRGMFEPVLPVCFQPFTFRRSAALGMTEIQRRGDASVQLKSWRRHERVDEIVLRVEYDNPQGAFASHRGWFYKWKAEIEGDGLRKPQDDFEALWLGENGVELAYRFQDVPSTADRVTWYVPLAIIKPEWTFEFDLRLTTGYGSKESD